MSSPSTESKPLREKSLPQTSIRFFLLLICVSALVMYTFRAAVVGNQFWAKIVSLLIATAGGCFILYAVLFLLANLFAATTAPLRKSRQVSQALKQTTGDGAKASDSTPTSDAPPVAGEARS